MILRDSLLRRNVAEDSTLLLIVASHVYKDDAAAFFVTAESAFFRNLLEEGNLDEPTASHVRAHLLFCESCIEEFYCLRRFSRRNSWDMVEKLWESLIDLGTTRLVQIRF
jgi:hypothetical protein